MEVYVKLQFKDGNLLKEMFDQTNVKKGEQIEISETCKVIVNKYSNYRSAELNQILELIFSWAGGVGTGIAANWLFEKIKGKKIKLTIDHQDIEVDEYKIKASFTKIVKE